MPDATPTPEQLRAILARVLLTVHDGDLDRAAEILAEARTARGVVEVAIGAAQLYVELLDDTQVGGADAALTKIAAAILDAEDDS
ncbi:hypothetical protein [Rhodococcus pyridinivorans]|uniref:hypothetical protein n=1 Tax=Rhodococcus pyridinivorans TaxID=103816 RepID=UPI00110D5207|nr:hypothetical protein [Rhodococcus pyridinivorans]